MELWDTYNFMIYSEPRTEIQYVVIYGKGSSVNNQILNLNLPIKVYSVIGHCCSLEEIDILFNFK